MKENYHQFSYFLWN